MLSACAVAEEMHQALAMLLDDLLKIIAVLITILLLVSLLKTIIRSFLFDILDNIPLVSVLMSVRCQQKLIDVIDAFLSGRFITTRFSSGRLDGDFRSAYGPAKPADRSHLPTVARSRGRICRRRRTGRGVRQPELLLERVYNNCERWLKRQRS